jgi:hypothetical protein
VLKAGIAFLSWLLLSAVLIEAGNREPGPICTGLTGLLVQVGGKRVRLCQVGAGDLQVVVTNAAPIHPLAQTCVANELHRPDGLINGVRYGPG